MQRIALFCLVYLTLSCAASSAQPAQEGERLYNSFGACRQTLERFINPFFNYRQLIGQLSYQNALIPLEISVLDRAFGVGEAYQIETTDHAWIVECTAPDGRTLSLIRLKGEQRAVEWLKRQSEQAQRLAAQSDPTASPTDNRPAVAPPALATPRLPPPGSRPVSPNPEPRGDISTFVDGEPEILTQFPPTEFQDTRPTFSPQSRPTTSAEATTSSANGEKPALQLQRPESCDQKLDALLQRVPKTTVIMDKTREGGDRFILFNNGARVGCTGGEYWSRSR